MDTARIHAAILIRSHVAGLVTSLNVKKGSFVSDGDVVAVIKSPWMKIELMATNAGFIKRVRLYNCRD